MQAVPLVKTSILAGTVGVITGAGSGIGAAAVRCFAAAGAKAIYASDVVDRNLQAVADGVAQEGYETEVIGVKTDITKSDQVEELVRKVIAEHGRLDWFFANAGIVDFEVLSTTTPEALTRMLDVNVVGAFNSVQWAARGMMNTSDAKPTPGGSIIITTSLASTFGGMGAPAYTISKHAAVGLVRAAATNLGMANTGIRVNGVGPGPTATAIAQNNMQGASQDAMSALMEHAKAAGSNPAAMSAVAPPEYIAQTAVFLASDMAAGVNGENIIVDKGLRQKPDPFSGLMFNPSIEPL
ncbi:hypothetical protein CcaverHIS002_0211790 [Cutaneotrichosporon cavernicola]|uniref:NAD(P)-binding protein n=1 Tax=Cutaneotrichosporon cavernicola TaxID=279322 RepID=A0AA48I546_9TREE|nr:uncharacterized protein CcaverHIS019_0211810 [Cutaneotrichosporon cavernicola]BEI82019.1 hypothetical protein CcaverHIS002_0211790 [Cutaneotrichosporon cavernicola]BEI89819.1 hypothetical protein CcaverHIS019_0211810 [Cutaneotrichosporon cavernicola]BEI97589.1 hypothetical protein CcaverHIS631_0211780 [Cutaneotrichosporon cavernicola]BEJ05368.1 hypothetical protein CcaverHIS641_0211850 [Cutaneotrichosporon cavernicola]